MEQRDRFGSIVGTDVEDPDELREWCEALDGVLAKQVD
jgi:hypothetical protein